MSILETFRRLVDADQARIEEAAQRVERERPRDESEAGKPPQRYRCRACELESTDGAFCPRCLADTMRLIEKNPR